MSGYMKIYFKWVMDLNLALCLFYAPLEAADLALEFSSRKHLQ